MTLIEIERTLGKTTVDHLLGSDDPLAAIVRETNSTTVRQKHAALVALYALVYPRVTSRKYDGA